MADYGVTPTLKSLSAFKTRLEGGGARPNLFEVIIPSFPAEIANQVWDDETKLDFRFFCKAAALPASNIAPVEIPFRGRILKVAGDRTFDSWTVTIINDEKFNLRHSFEAWMNMIGKMDNATGAVNPDSYTVDGFVHQLGRSNKRLGTGVRDAETRPAGTTDLGPGQGSTGASVTNLRTYRFDGIFPTNVSQIDLSYDTGDTIEEFTVEFQVQYFEMQDNFNGRIV
jgi:hypothetical protein